MEPHPTSALHASDSADASARPRAASRRRFLTMLATGATASVSPPLLATASSEHDADAASQRGYCHTEHIGKYYMTARL